VENGVGYGEHTALKQEHFEKILRLHMNITTSVQRNWRHSWYGPDLETYHYFDINAGAGNDPTGLIGSPLIFLRQAALLNLQYKAVLIEQELVNVQSLLRLVGTDKNVTIEYGDHHVCLPRYFVNGRKRFGLVYADPSGTVPPFELLGQMSRQNIYQRLDICIYLHATNIKRIRNQSSGNGKQSLAEFMAMIDKKHWIIRKPVGKEQWTFLIGSNWVDYPDWTREGFYKWKSPIGIEILDRLTYTADELDAKRGQLPFSFLNGPNPATGPIEPTENI
jgi:hypothetical protein